jgi:hypothetical protein
MSKERSTPIVESFVGVAVGSRGTADGEGDGNNVGVIEMLGTLDGANVGTGDGVAVGILKQQPHDAELPHALGANVPLPVSRHEASLAKHVPPIASHRSIALVGADVQTWGVGAFVGTFAQQPQSSPQPSSIQSPESAAHRPAPE